MEKRPQFESDDQRRWWMFENLCEVIDLTERMATRIDNFHQELTGVKSDVKKHSTDIEDCRRRDDSDKKLILDVKKSVDGIHNALINERKNTLRIVDQSASAKNPVPPWLIKYTAIVVAITVTIALFGSLYIGFQWLVKYAATH